MTSKIHSTAIIDKNAKIADDVEIGPYTIIGENVIIGKKSKIYSSWQKYSSRTIR